MLNDNYRKVRRGIIDNMGELASRYKKPQGVVAWMFCVVAWMFYAPVAIFVVMVVLLVKLPLMVFFNIFIQIIKLGVLPIVCLIAIYDVLSIGWWFMVRKGDVCETTNR